MICGINTIVERIIVGNNKEARNGKNKADRMGYNRGYCFLPLQTGHCWIRNILIEI
jgi:hypothetical protein